MTTLTTTTTWRIELPIGLKLLNANQNLHYRRKAELIKTIRTTAWTIARSQKIPNLQRAHAYYVIHPHTRTTRRDPGNWAPTAKAAIDGLVDAHVLPDDDSTRLLGPDPRIGTPIKGSQFVLWITDLDQMNPQHLALLNPPGATQ
ncbi:hypothetical protein [Streptomyces sp. Ac-502]|uniref:hypothetical protein n=1 Tax=Streptomyces sp. Ac-502 TaxID=3342801 RepID=UPI00386272FE